MTTDDSGTLPTSAPEPSTLQRRWLRLIIGLIAVNLVVLAGILIWNYPRFGRVEIVDPDPPPATNAPVVASGGEGDFSGEAPAAGEALTEAPSTGAGAESGGLEPVTFLVMGSDSREDLPSELGVTDRVAGQRADVIMIASLEGGRIRLLSLPRDLRVEIGGIHHKLNAAYAIEGPNPQLLYDTVEAETGIDLDYYVELDFAGFAAIVDELGGVDVTFPYPARDLKSHLNVGAGVRHLDGATALAYARSRQYEENRDGEWVLVDGSDLGRIGRQQSLLFTMLDALKNTSILDLDQILGVMGALERHIRIDARLSVLKVVELVSEVRNLNREDIEVLSLPVLETTVDGVYYLVAKQPEAGEVYRAFAAPVAAGVPEGETAVPMVIKVLNGNGADGQATKWSEELRNSGFMVLQVDDAALFSFDSTVVTVRPDDFEKGERIIDALGFGRVEPGTLNQGLDAVVVIGADALGR